MIVTIFTERDYGDVFTVKFYDGNGDPTLPDTVIYRVDCITNATGLVAPTEITAATSIDITTTDAWTQVVDTSNIYESRRLSVSASGEGWAKTAYTTYKVHNPKRIE